MAECTPEIYRQIKILDLHGVVPADIEFGNTISIILAIFRCGVFHRDDVTILTFHQPATILIQANAFVNEELTNRPTNSHPVGAYLDRFARVACVKELAGYI